MKKITLIMCSLAFLPSLAQEHFSGISTSKRVGILNGNMNPAEFANLSSRFEVNLVGFSVNASSNKVGFSDIVNGNNLEDKIFSGNEPINFNTDAEISLPGFAFKALGFGFAISSGAHIKANVIDVDPTLGNALAGNNLLGIIGSTNIDQKGNQRVNATIWGEIGLSAAHKIFENDKHKINGGITFKMLFPGSYANLGLNGLTGTITADRLTQANGSLNIAYSGSLANNFTDGSDYTSSLFGKLKGLATDIGVTYEMKKGDSYRLKAGASVKNIGSMTFKDNDNKSTNYKLDINDGVGLDLNEFNNVESVKDVEQVLIAHPEYFTETNTKQDFKVKLPTVLNLYADVNIIPKLNVTLFLQQKMSKDDKNDQIAEQNIFSITPRVNVSFFEAFLPVSFNEISGTTAGLGFRLSGFYIGSSSILTAITSDSKQADAFLGYRFGFL